MNLLPIEEQIKIRNERLLRLAEVVLSGLAVLVFISVILLFSAYIFLALQYGELDRQLSIDKQSTELKRAQSLDQSIRDLNTNSRALVGNEQLIRNPLTEVGALLSVKPYGINITSIGYDRAENKSNSTIIVSGEANTRNNLLRYVSALESGNVFANVNSPVSNLLSREKLSFTLVLDLK